MGDVMEKLGPYLLGWKAHFGLAQNPTVWRGLHEGLRHQLRAIQLQHWKRGTVIYCELIARGSTHGVAGQVARTATAGGATVPRCSTAC